MNAMDIKFHGNLTKEEFWLEWFGLAYGRELGTNKHPHRRFTDNPRDILDFIEMCDTEHDEKEKNHHCRPCWVSVLAYTAYGIPVAMDRIFFDFDDDSKYCPECNKYYPKNDWKHLVKDKKTKGVSCKRHKCDVIVKPRKDIVGFEVRKFLNSIMNRGEPLIIETYKGYHVYLFLKDALVFRRENEKFAKQLYGELKERYGINYRFLDGTTNTDIKQLARIPLTRHEKSGKPCIVVNRQLKPDKVRSVNYYRSFPIPVSEIKKAMLQLKLKEEQKAKEEIERIERNITDIKTGSFTGRIRPCFKARMDAGHMTHAMRLPFLIEAYFSGHKTEDQLVNLFRDFADFKEDITTYQVKYFLEHGPEVFPPYRCETIIDKGWCIGDECPTRKRKFYK